MAIELAKPYKASLTFGRFNLPHNGHLRLFREMAKFGEQIYIGISDNFRNIPPQRRLNVLGKMLEADNLRYSIIPAPNPFAFFEKIRSLGVEDETISVIFGEDQFALGASANRAFGWDDHTVSRLTSSTALRSHIDNGEWDLVSRLVPTSIITDVIQLRGLEVTD